MATYPLDDAIEIFHQASSEFELRMAISRAYYVALSHMMDVAQQNGFRESRQRTDHHRLFEFFASHSEKHLRRMGSVRLPQIYEARLAADYDYDIDVSVPMAREALQDAVHICTRVTGAGIAKKTSRSVEQLEKLGAKSAFLPKKDPVKVLEDLAVRAPTQERRVGVASQTYLFYFRHMRALADKLGYEASGKGADHKRLRKFFEALPEAKLKAAGSEKLNEYHQLRIQADYHPEEFEMSQSETIAMLRDVHTLTHINFPLSRAESLQRSLEKEPRRDRRKQNKRDRRGASFKY